MLSFFRKIRKSLISEGKTTRYFKYAIGEILLVVIGILIALQINNWNESNKARVYEIKMLKEIQFSLMQDMDYINAISTRIGTVDTESQAVLTMFKRNEVNEDELIKRIKDMYIGFVIHFNDGAYEALKSTGIERVTNDKLRSGIIDFYEFKIPRMMKILANSDNDLLKQQQHELLWELFDFNVSDYKYQEGELVLDIHKFKNEDYQVQQLFEFLYLTVHQAKQAKFRLGFLMEDLQELLQLLEHEL
ncbi:MAG: DUF6090 family protein, partial [Marinicella sp.]